MDISFLTCLRLAEGRLRTALASQSGRSGALGGLRRRLGVLRPLAEVPLGLPRAARFYLPERTRPNSKAEAVVRELGEPTLSPGALWQHSGGTNSVWRQGTRLLLRLPLYLPLLVRSQRRGSRMDQVDQRILMGWVVRCRLLRRHPDVAPIIISDLSPDLHMLWSAALREGNPVLWWQDDYHHTKPLPQPVAAAAVLNQGGFDAVRSTAPLRVPIFARPSLELEPTRPIPPDPVVGVATNAFFGRSPEDFQLLDAIRERLGVKELRLRLHPNSQLSQADFSGQPLQVAPVYETISEFAGRVDLGIVGNSAVQLKLLCEGLPVVHVKGLDPHGFDMYGYVEKGLLPGCLDVAELILRNIREFYETESPEKTLRDLVRFPETERACPLRALNSVSWGTAISRVYKMGSKNSGRVTTVC